MSRNKNFNIKTNPFSYTNHRRHLRPSHLNEKRFSRLLRQQSGTSEGLTDRACGKVQRGWIGFRWRQSPMRDDIYRRLFWTLVLAIVAAAFWSQRHVVPAPAATTPAPGATTPAPAATTPAPTNTNITEKKKDEPCRRRDKHKFDKCQHDEHCRHAQSIPAELTVIAQAIANLLMAPAPSAPPAPVPYIVNNNNVLAQPPTPPPVVLQVTCQCTAAPTPAPTTAPTPTPQIPTVTTPTPTPSEPVYYYYTVPQWQQILVPCQPRHGR